MDGCLLINKILPYWFSELGASYLSRSEREKWDGLKLSDEYLKFVAKLTEVFGSVFVEDGMVHENQGRTRELQLRFGGKSTNDRVVPVGVLVQSLQSFQRAVHLLGMRHEGKEVRQRLRISTEVEMRYVVLCKLPEPGSFIAPIVIGDTDQTLFDYDAISSVTCDLFGIVDAVNAQDSSRVRALLPDPIFRIPILSSLAKMAPPKRSGINVYLQNRAGRSLFEPALVSEFIERVIEPQPQVSDPTVATVTGRLIGIDFSERMLRLHYPPTMRELKCSYHESVEEMLLGKPREYVQVVGQVILDKDREPERIIDVERILEVDLTPIVVPGFASGGCYVRSRRSVTFEVSLDESAQFHCIESGAFGIDLIAGTRVELEHDLLQELDVLWRQYALEADEHLTGGARELKKSLLDAFEVVAQ
ncbi:putative Recombination-associated protein RdgC [Azospirillaceae bacterium]